MSGHYPRNAWYVASWSHELPVNRPFGIRILGNPVVIYRTDSGRLVALEDRCVHRLAPLSLGRCEGEKLRCQYHGLLYSPDGRVVEIPGQPEIPERAKVHAYPVVERHSWVWVWMGPAELADETLIPPAIGLDHPDWILGSGHIDYQAEARLVHENLLDFSHLPFLHTESFGPPPSFSTERPKLTALERGVRLERWLCDAQPVFKTDTNVDGWTDYDFLAPGVLLMWSGSFPVGSAAEWNYGKPDYSRSIRDASFTCQAVTPLTDKTSRYFFSWGPHATQGNAALRDVMMGIARKAFEEDRIMIEAQQGILDATPDPQVMPMTCDRAITIFSQVMRRLARA